MTTSSSSPKSAPSARPVPVRILAAVDYSEIATLVVEEAASLARQKHAAQLHFLHVNDLYSGDREQELRHAELLEWLEPRLKGAVDIGNTKVMAHEQSGDAARLILELASDLSAETVVVGTHDRKGVQRLLLGSVAAEVVQKCGSAVLVVRPRRQDAAAIPFEPPCPACVAARAQSGGEVFWCEQHAQRHGRRHTYYDPRSTSWVSQRIVS